MTVKLFLADDHEIVRDGLKALLQPISWVVVVGEAADGRTVLKEVGTTGADYVVMDIAMPEMNGIEATRQLVEKHPGVKIIILSVYATTEHIYRAFEAGAMAYVLKESAGRELIDAIRSVQYNRRFVSASIKKKNPDIQEDIGKFQSPVDRLSRREREILQLVVEGRSSAAIALSLALSPKTVETYRSRLMAKLHLKDLPSLVKFAIQHGLTSL